jgi:Ni,Fe-hydrogenase I small subunit
VVQAGALENGGVHAMVVVKQVFKLAQLPVARLAQNQKMQWTHAAECTTNAASTLENQTQQKVLQLVIKQLLLVYNLPTLNVVATGLARLSATL